MVHSSEDMASVLNDFFAGVFTREGAGPVPEAEPMGCRTKLESSQVTVEKIKDKIRILRANSAAGTDKIGPSLLQTLLDEVAPVLEIIYRRSLEEGEVPEDWCSAKVTPIFKKGTK